MAVIRDMIPAFELFQPTSADDAIELLIRYGEDGWVLGGGLDSFDWWKERIKRPTAVVDLVNVDELKGVRSTADGMEIGAMTTLTEVARHPGLLANYSVSHGRCLPHRDAPDSEPGYDRGQFVAGHALLVLPRWVALLPGRR